MSGDSETVSDLKKEIEELTSKNEGLRLRCQELREKLGENVRPTKKWWVQQADESWMLNCDQVVASIGIGADSSGYEIRLIASHKLVQPLIGDPQVDAETMEDTLVKYAVDTLESLGYLADLRAIDT